MNDAGIRVRPPRYKTADPLILKQADWPRIDRQAWDLLFEAGDILDGDGPCIHWAEGGRQKRAQSYGHWLAFLAANNRLDVTVDVTKRATPEIMRAFAEQGLKRCHIRSIEGQLYDLLALFKAMSPSKDWQWLHTMANQLRIRRGPNSLKPRPPVLAAEVIRWARRHMAEADDPNSGTSWQRAIRFREGLMIGFLGSRMLRLRSLMLLTVDQHLYRTETGYAIALKAADMKNKKPSEFELPKVLVLPMHRYLTIHRPALLRGLISDKLWISRYGTPLTYGGFQRQLPDVTFRAFGEPMRAHAFRHIAATSVAIEDPEHVGIIAPLLGHATLDMAEKHYNRASNVEANREYQKLIRRHRRGRRSQTGKESP